MSVPQPISDRVTPDERGRSLRRQQVRRRQHRSRAARLRSLGWEMTGRLTVNLALSLVAISTLARLVPYYQSQRQVLQEMESSVAAAEQRNQQLRADFTRYFDPSKTSQVVQENGVLESNEYIPIVLVDPLAPPTDARPGE